MNTREINEAKDWLKDCEWREGFDAHSEIDAASDEQIIKAIEKNYAGGVKQFIHDVNC